MSAESDLLMQQFRQAVYERLASPGTDLRISPADAIERRLILFGDWQSELKVKGETESVAPDLLRHWAVADVTAFRRSPTDRQAEAAGHISTIMSASPAYSKMLRTVDVNVVEQIEAFTAINAKKEATKLEGDLQFAAEFNKGADGVGPLDRSSSLRVAAEGAKELVTATAMALQAHYADDLASRESEGAQAKCLEEKAYEKLAAVNAEEARTAVAAERAKIVSDGQLQSSVKFDEKMHRAAVEATAHRLQVASSVSHADELLEDTPAGHRRREALLPSDWTGDIVVEKARDPRGGLVEVLAERKGDAPAVRLALVDGEDQAKALAAQYNLIAKRWFAADRQQENGFGPSAAADRDTPVQEPVDPKSIISKVLENATYKTRSDGSVLYLINQRSAFVDHGEQIIMAPKADKDEESILAAVLLAKEKYGGEFELTGDDDFKRRAIEIILKHELDVKLKHPQQEALRRELAKARDTAVATASAEVKADAPVTHPRIGKPVPDTTDPATSADPTRQSDRALASGGSAVTEPSSVVSRAFAIRSEYDAAKADLAAGKPGAEDRLEEATDEAVGLGMSDYGSGQFKIPDVIKEVPDLVNAWKYGQQEAWREKPVSTTSKVESEAEQSPEDRHQQVRDWTNTAQGRHAIDTVMDRLYDREPRPGTAFSEMPAQTVFADMYGNVYEKLDDAGATVLRANEGCVYPENGVIPVPPSAEFDMLRPVLKERQDAAVAVASEMPSAGPREADLVRVNAHDWWEVQRAAIGVWAKSDDELQADLAQLGPEPGRDVVYWFDRAGRPSPPPVKEYWVDFAGRSMTKEQIEHMGEDFSRYETLTKEDLAAQDAELLRDEERFGADAFDTVGGAKPTASGPDASFIDDLARWQDEAPGIVAGTDNELRARDAMDSTANSAAVALNLNLKELAMTVANEGNEQDPKLILRGVRKLDSGEFDTTVLLFKGKGDYLQGYVKVGDQKHQVIAHLNPRKPDPETGEVKPNFLKLAEAHAVGDDTKWKEIGFGNAVNHRKDNKPVYFDEVLFSVGNEVVKARVTKHVDAAMHRELGFVEDRKPRPKESNSAADEASPKSSAPAARQQGDAAGAQQPTRNTSSRGDPSHTAVAAAAIADAASGEKASRPRARARA